MDFPLNHNFPTIFLWISHETTIVLWFSYGFPMVFLSNHHQITLFLQFPIDFPWKTTIFLWFSYGFPMVFLSNHHQITIFLQFSNRFPVENYVFLWFSYGFPIKPPFCHGFNRHVHLRRCGQVSPSARCRYSADTAKSSKPRGHGARCPAPLGSHGDLLSRICMVCRYILTCFYDS